MHAMRIQVKPTAAGALAQQTEHAHDDKVQEVSTDKEDGRFEPKMHDCMSDHSKAELSADTRSIQPECSASIVWTHGHLLHVQCLQH